MNRRVGEGQLRAGLVELQLPNTPTLLLTTTGRESGKQLTMPLIYGKAG